MQFSSIPARKFRIRGIKVRIPGAGASSSGTPTVDIKQLVVLFIPDGYIFNGVMGLLHGVHVLQWYCLIY